MGILEFLTGRSAEEESFYSDENAVNSVKEQLSSVKSSNIPNARDAVVASIESLNNLLNGYVSPMNTSTVGEAFDLISQQIDGVSNKMSQTAADIKAYSEADTFTKSLATIGMVAAKPLEGFLSVFEGLGDGVLSAVGFVAGGLGFKGVQEGIGNFIKTDWSHDIFQYDKWAKYSAITEDSAIGQGLNLVGKVGGFVAAGALATSVLGISASATYGAGLLQASGGTIAASAAAGLSGLGEGTEASLQQGKDYDQAFFNGVGQGILQGGLAFASGVAMERLAGFLSKGAKAATDSADDAARAAADSADDAARAAADSADDAAKAASSSADDVATSSARSGPDYEQLARDHGFYTADGTKVEVEISPDGTIPDAALKHHVLQGEGVTKAKGIRGAHTSNAMQNTYASSDFSSSPFTLQDCITSTRKTTNGIIEYEYRIPARNAQQEFTGGFCNKVYEPKTVFDSAQYTDDQVWEIFREAIDDFLEHQDITVIPGRANYPFKCYSKSGIPFSGYISSTTGEITTIYPNLRLPHSLQFI